MRIHIRWLSSRAWRRGTRRTTNTRRSFSEPPNLRATMTGSTPRVFASSTPLAQRRHCRNSRHRSEGRSESFSPSRPIRPRTGHEISHAGFASGNLGLPERAPSVVLQSHRVEEDGSVRIEAAVRRRDDLGKRLSGEPILTFLKESGGRGRVRWAELTPVGDGVAVEDGKTLHISPNTRTARFRAVSDPTSHPAPAREAAATVAFLPGREES